MVSIIENRSTITGTILSVSEDADARGFIEVMIDLASAVVFGDYPNLARTDEGSTIRVRMQKTFFSEGGFKVGDSAELTVRKAAGQVYFVQE